MSGKTYGMDHAVREIEKINKFSEKAKTKKVKKMIIYPNALESHDLENCLFNKFDRVMGVWRDGLIPRFIRQAEVSDDDSLSLLVLDGDVRSSWAENLNSLEKVAEEGIG